MEGRVGGKAMKNPKLSIFLIILSTFVTTSALFFMKKGAAKLTPSLVALLANHSLIVGLGLYGLGAMTMIVALKYGDLGMVYPFLSLSFIWVAIISVVLLGEVINPLNWVGIIAIVTGVVFMGVGGK
jgi:drug/metabolite transporter (DMT)-like permease